MSPGGFYGRARKGFTLIEVVTAILVITVAVLALASTLGLVTRMMTRGRNAEVAGTFVARRLDLLRLNACTAPATGADTLIRSSGGGWSVINAWTLSGASNSTMRAILVTSFRGQGGVTRTDTTETSFSCAF